MIETTVSIIIPTYNSCELLKRAISSVINQTYKNWEAIIIDNYSKDNTQIFINTIVDKRIKYIQTNNEGIIAKSRNIGIENSKGKYIAFLDADDWWTKDKLEKSLIYLQQGNLITYHDLIIKGSWKIKIKNRKKIISRKLLNPIDYDLYQNGNGIPNSSVVIDKKILQKIGGLSENPSLIGAEDYECWLRVAKETNKFCKIPESLGYYWIGESNTSNPKRSIVWLHELQKLKHIYTAPIDQGKAPHWITFALTEGYFKLKQYDESERYGRKLLGEKISHGMLIKVAYILIASRLNKLLKW